MGELFFSQLHWLLLVLAVIVLFAGLRLGVETTPKGHIHRLAALADRQQEANLEITENLGKLYTLRQNSRPAQEPKDREPQLTQ